MGEKWRGKVDGFAGDPVSPPPGYFMDHAVQLQDLPVRYWGAVSCPGTPSPCGDPPLPSSLRGFLWPPIPWGVFWGPLSLSPPTPGSCAPAPATAQRPTRAASPGGSTACTSSPRYWEHWEGALRGERRGGHPLCPPKVEMFGVTAAERGTESEELLDEFLGLQKEIFSELGLHYR